MLIAPIPADEDKRLDVLRSYALLDSNGDEALTALVRVASQVCGTPIALVSLVDEHRQWFLANEGLGATETHRDVAFCSHAILDQTLMEVNDTAKDTRFADNPLVTDDPKIQFYAGQPLINSEGLALGTLCVIDRVPRTLTPAQRATLKELSRAVIRLMDLRRAGLNHANSVTQQRRQQDIETTRVLATGIGHQLNNPLMVVQGSLSLAIEELDQPHKVMSLRENLQLAEDGMDQLRSVVKSIQKLGRAPLPGEADVGQAFAGAQERLQALTGRCTIDQDLPSLPKVAMSLADLVDVLVVLIENAIDALPPEGARKVSLYAKLSSAGLVELYVQDTGHGIPEALQGRVFHPLFTTHAEAKLGLGLSTARCRVYMSGGDLDIYATSEQGTTMRVSLPTAD
jgi:signal transduction histidine kinase